MSLPHTFQVKIHDTQQTLYEGPAERITSYNEMGRFDVYPAHANFISILKQQIDVYNNHQKVKEIPIDQAILKVKNDVVNIFLGIEALYVEDEPSSSTPLQASGNVQKK